MSVPFRISWTIFKQIDYQYQIYLSTDSKFNILSLGKKFEYLILVDNSFGNLIILYSWFSKMVYNKKFDSSFYNIFCNNVDIEEDLLFIIFKFKIILNSLHTSAYVYLISHERFYIFQKIIFIQIFIAYGSNLYGYLLNNLTKLQLYNFL